MPQFPAERFRAGAQFFVHTAAAGRFALQRTQSIRGKSRYKRFQRGYISRRLKESTASAGSCGTRRCTAATRSGKG